ncbi:MAG: hypothetical protein QNL01_13480 [Akkermansiaceae bacterium]
MIEPIPQLPDHTLGFTASGKVTGSDYEQHIIPAVEAACNYMTKSTSSTTSAKTSPASIWRPPGMTPKWGSSTSPPGTD